MVRRWRVWRRLGEQERWWWRLGVGVAHGRRGQREARRGSLGEGEVVMGRPWRAWWRLGQRERREQGPGGSWWRLGERERHEWVVEARWRCGERERRGWVCCAGQKRERRCLRDRASSLESGHAGGVGGSWGASRRAAWYLGGGGVACPPWIRHGGVRWTQRLVVRLKRLSLVGLGLEGPFSVDVVVGGIRCLVQGVWPLVVWWGMGVERPVAAIPYAGAARARRFVARWGRVVGSGSGGGGVGCGGGLAAGGGGAGSGGDGAAGMVLRPLMDIPVPLVGLGARASCAVPGAVLFGGQRGRVGGRA